MPQFNGIQGTPADFIRILGVIIDRNLNWNAQVNSITTKVKRPEEALRKLTASTWGANIRQACKLYRAMVRSVLTYGAEAWFVLRGNVMLSKSQQAKLRRAQNACLQGSDRRTQGRIHPGTAKGDGSGRYCRVYASLGNTNEHADEIERRRQDHPEPTGKTVRHTAGPT